MHTMHESSKIKGCVCVCVYIGMYETNFVWFRERECVRKNKKLSAECKFYGKLLIYTSEFVAFGSKKSTIFRVSVL